MKQATPSAPRIAPGATQKGLRVALSLSLALSVAVRAALVDSGLDYEDALGTGFAKPACGIIGGGWRVAQTNGTTAVFLPSGYSTPMWDLRLFSGGNNDGNRGNRITTLTDPDTGEVISATTNRVVGAADIPINAQTLDAWRQTFSNARSNGALVSPRFAYDQSGITGCEPSDFSVILTHIRQIAGVLNEFADIVPSIECGIIGPFGEMHSSMYDDTVYAPQIIRAWLHELDPRIKVQVRSPKYLFRLLDNCSRAEDLLARQDEFDPDRRLGLFDDGYLGTIYNYGTYNGFISNGGVNNFNRRQAMQFLRERPHIPYGGECAGVPAETAAGVLDTFANNGWNLVEEWYDSHLSYLRGITGGVGATLNARTFSLSEYGFDGAPDLHEWDGLTLADFLRAHIGHRFVLRGSRLSDAAAPGGTLSLTFAIENTGFTDLPSPSRTEVLLQSSGDRFWACPVALDLGAAIPSRTNATLALTLQLPSALAEGDWNVYLRTHLIADGDSPSRAGQRTVRFANPDAQWNSTLGANLLGSVHVVGTAPAPGLGFRESGAAGTGATAPQLVLASLPMDAPLFAELADWAGGELCVFAPGASELRYWRGGAEWPSTNGVAVLPEDDAALGIWAISYVLDGATIMRDLLMIDDDIGAGHTWRLETRDGRLRAVCGHCGGVRDPMPGHDRELPGRAMASLPATNAVLTFASPALPFTVDADPACRVLYPAFAVTDVPVGGARLGDLYTTTAPPGSTSYLHSNSSGNLNSRNGASYDPASQTVAIPTDGAYLTDIGFWLVNWSSPSQYGNVRDFSLNSPAATRGGRSSGLESAELATLGLFTADPRFHVWFCDEDWTVLCETNGPIAGNLAGNYHAIPIPAATDLFTGTPPAQFTSTDDLCRRLRGWKRLDGAAPGWALGSVALVPDYAETEHQWETADGEAGAAVVLRCRSCGQERTLPELVRWFDVRFTHTGYHLGTNWHTGATDGTWTRPSGDATSLVEATGRGRVLSLASTSSPIWYAPSEASSNGVDLVVEGGTAVHPFASPALLPAATSGALAFVAIAPDPPLLVDEATEAVAYGHAADGWRRLDSAAFPIGAWTAWRMELDLSSASAPRIRYLVDGEVLADGTGAEWLPLAQSIDHVAGVGFVGSGFAGDFRGMYADFGGTGPTVEPPQPVFGATSEGPALSFAVDPATGAPRLVVRIANAAAGAYYTAFTSETLTGPFTAEGDSQLAETNGAFAFEIDATPASKFIIVVAGDVFHRDGDPLP